MNNQKKEYIFPPMSLLNNEELEEKKQYNLSKLLLKKDMNDKLIIPIGIDNEKNRYYIDLKSNSGIFIGGETGSGKSVLLDSIIITLLLKNSPDELKLLLINQSKVEFMQYENIPHLLTNIVSEPKEAIKKINDIIKIIDERTEKLYNAKIKNIEEYNKTNNEKLSHIIILIDESTDIMKEPESKELLEIILKKGYYLGIHLILATSAYFKADFDKEFIKLFKYVLSFDLASKEQAKFINLKGADLLTIAGEMMIKTKENVDTIQTPFISTEEIENVVNFINRNDFE